MGYTPRPDRRTLLKIGAAAASSVAGVSTSTSRARGTNGATPASLSLTVAGAPAEASGTVTLECTLVNRGDTEATGIRGYVERPSREWLLADSGENRSLAAGGRATVPVTFTVPEDAEGANTFEIRVEDDADNGATDTTVVSVSPDQDDGSIVERYDANSDGEIDIRELNDAAQDYISGDIDIAELNRVAQAFVNS